MVNSLTCSAKVKPSQIKLPLISVTTISSLNNQVGLQGVVPSIAVSAEAAAEMSGLAMLTENAINGSTVSDHHPAVVSGIRNGSTAVVESAAGLLPSGVGVGSLQDSKINPVSSVVKMEVLDDLFGSYGWDESASAMAAAVSAAASNNPFSSLLSQMTPLTSASTSTISTVATTKGTVKVPMASETSTTTEALPPQGVDTTFSPPPPPSSLPTISLASSLTTESLRVIIPSPHPGPDTTTTMGGSPVANHNNHTPTTPAPPTTPSSVASSSSTSSKKTVFTAKGMLLLLDK